MPSACARRRVVCGIDNSDLASAAARVAHALAERLGCGLMMVYVAEMEEDVAGSASEFSHVQKAAASASKSVFDQVVRDHGLHADLHVELGQPAERLAAVAEQDEAPLIVVGSRGRGIVRRVLGSVSNRLARRAPCPVVIVSRAAAARGELFSTQQREPLVVVGLENDHDFRPLMLAVDLTKRLYARLLIAHVYEAPPPMGLVPPRDALSDADWVFKRGHDLLRQAEHMAQSQGVSEVEARLVAGQPAVSLNALAKKESAQLIVIGSRGRGWIRSALLGSVSSALATSAPVPVAILPKDAPSCARTEQYELAFGATKSSGIVR
jgi:nucleotide-binding universal stress UspA family protein